jgi:endonuclease YncB( thermonuclease family)
MRTVFNLLLLATALSCQAEQISGTVVRVADGDSLTIQDLGKVTHSVRLAGIDAPEMAQAFGRASRDSLATLVAGKPVTVQTYKKDRYGRLVGKVMLDGIDVNLEQVRTGMAWFYREFSHEQTEADQQRYDQAERQAVDRRRGLWALEDPIAPWEFRMRHTHR